MILRADDPRGTARRALDSGSFRPCPHCDAVAFEIHWSRSLPDWVSAQVECRGCGAAWVLSVACAASVSEHDPTAVERSIMRTWNAQPEGT